LGLIVSREGCASPALSVNRARLVPAVLAMSVPSPPCPTVARQSFAWSGIIDDSPAAGLPEPRRASCPAPTAPAGAGHRPGASVAAAGPNRLGRARRTIAHSPWRDSGRGCCTAATATPTSRRWISIPRSLSQSDSRASTSHWSRSPPDLARRDARRRHLPSCGKRRWPSRCRWHTLDNSMAFRKTWFAPPELRKRVADAPRATAALLVQSVRALPSTASITSTGRVARRWAVMPWRKPSRNSRKSLALAARA
jgi:hypothetical protein